MEDMSSSDSDSDSSSSSFSSFSSSSSSSSSGHHYSLDEIKGATNNFDEKKVLGHGGEGKVYLGEIHLGSENEKSRVAVKRLKEDSNEFEKEIRIVSNIQHPHLVSLLGYCKESDQKILIYEYMEKGSLSNYVKRNSGSMYLSWKQRLKICLGAARGLQHLHKETDEFPKGIIHRDVKPANILLGENWVAKVSDFGTFKLSIAGQTNSAMITDLRGTCGYYAPEYFRSFQITRKIDVYAFGVVLFEVLCRKKPWERGDESYYVADNEDLGLWAQENVDAKIKTEISYNSLNAFTDIIGRSLRSDQNRRPTMSGVVLALETALKHQEREDERIGNIHLKATSVFLRQRHPSSAIPPPPSPTSASIATPSDDIQTVSVTSRRTQASGSASGSSIPPKKASLHPLYWMKITRPVQGSLWADSQIQENESREREGERHMTLNHRAPEIDISELESFFSTASASDGPGKGRRGSKGNESKKVQLVDLRRAAHCEIMLKTMKIPLADIISAVFAWDASALEIDQVENLIRFFPTNEEMDLLKGYKGDKEMLGKCEQFFMELIKVPRVDSKLSVLYVKMTFPGQVNDLRHNLTTINYAAREVKESTKLRQIMQTILTLGNALNQGTARGSARGFRLDSLLKLSETRARNSKMTLMHYLCKLLAEKMPELLDFDEDLVHLEAASKVQLKSLAEEMQAVVRGFQKVEPELTASENDGAISASFREGFKSFLDTAEAEVKLLISLYSEVGRNADTLAVYFGEDPSRTPFEQVTQILVTFVKMFNKARDENEQQADAKKKKWEMEAAANSLSKEKDSKVDSEKGGG